MADRRSWFWAPAENVQIEVIQHFGSVPVVRIAGSALEGPEAQLESLQEAALEALETYRALKLQAESEDEVTTTEGVM